MSIITTALYIDPVTRTKKRIGLSGDVFAAAAEFLDIANFPYEPGEDPWPLSETDLGGGLTALSLYGWDEMGSEDDGTYFVTTALHRQSMRRCCMPTIIIGAPFGEIVDLMEQIVFVDPDAASYSDHWN